MSLRRKRYDMTALLIQAAPKVHHNLPKAIITLNSLQAIIVGNLLYGRFANGVFLSFLFTSFLHQLVELLDSFVGDRLGAAGVAGGAVGIKKGMLKLLVREVAFHFRGGEFRLDEISLADLAEHILGEDEADASCIVGIVPRMRILHPVSAASAARALLEDKVALILTLYAAALDSELLGNALDDLIEIF